MQGQVVEISFNLQAAVDAKHNLVVATHTINKNDRSALSAIALEAKENLAIETYTALVDKGYHNGKQIEICKQANITTIVAQPEQGKNQEKIAEDYLISKFQYNVTNDTYTCPQGQTLTTTGHWHKKTDKESYTFKRYRTSKCRTCPAQHLCTSRKEGRNIDRSHNADAVEENNKRYHENPQLYRKRQEINSLSRFIIGKHIFGTIKRKWGYNYTDLVGLEKVNGEHSLIMLVYNIKRSINILGVPDLVAKLQKWNSPYKRKDLFLLKTTYLKLKLDLVLSQTKLAA